MQLVYFGVLLTAFFGAIYDEMLQREANDCCLSWCLGLVVVFGAFGKFMAWRTRYRIEKTRNVRLHLTEYENARQLTLWLWIAISPIYLPIFGWGDCSRQLLPDVDSLAWTFVWWSFPSVLVLTLLDAARHQLYRSTHFKALSGSRYGWLVMMLPCFLTCILWDTTTSISTLLFGSDRISPVVIACFLTVLLAALLPLLMIRFWSTERLGSNAKDEIVKDTWLTAGGDLRAIRLWKTNSSIAGAMVLGWCRPFRFLLLSDLLIEKLDSDELRMIVLHEAAHCKRWHVWLRMLPVWTMSIPIVAIHHPSFLEKTLRLFPCSSSFIQPCVVILSIVSMCLFLSWIARWTEFDADKLAVELAGFAIGGKFSNHGLRASHEDQRSTFSQQQAARALIRALEKLTPTIYTKKQTWLHPSLDRRTKSLTQHYFNEPTLVVESKVDANCLTSPF